MHEHVPALKRKKRQDSHFFILLTVVKISTKKQGSEHKKI